jgi:hypothetical protein
LTVSTADRSVLTLQRLYTFTTARVKVLKNFEPNHAMLAKHHTTLLRCDCIGTLQSLYKGMQKTTTHIVTVAERTITPLVDNTLGKAAAKRTDLYPFNFDPLCSFRIRLSESSTHLINWLSQSHMDCGCTVFLGGSACSN